MRQGKLRHLLLVCTASPANRHTRNSVPIINIKLTGHLKTKSTIFTFYFKHLSPEPAVFPGSNAAMGGAKLKILKHVACHVSKHSADSRRENTLLLLTGLGKGYCSILLPQIRPEGKVLSSQIEFCGHTTRMCRWRDVIAGSSTPILPIRN